MERVSGAVKAMNEALVNARGRQIRVELGIVEPATYNTKAAKNWREVWTDDGMAVRFTREEIATYQAPLPPVVDGEPKIPAMEG